MGYIVSVRFVNNRAYSNANKDKLIFALPPVYRVSREVLNDMDNLGCHHFVFKGYAAAANFAREIFFNHSNTFSISINFTIQQ